MAGQGPRSRSPSGTRTQTLEKHRQAKCWRQSRALGHPSALVAYAWPEGAAGVPCCLHHRPYTFNDHQVGLTPSLLDRSAGCFHGPPWARPTSLLPVLPTGAGSSPWTVRSNRQRGLTESTGAPSNLIGANGFAGQDQGRARFVRESEARPAGAPLTMVLARRKNCRHRRTGHPH